MGAEGEMGEGREGGGKIAIERREKMRERGREKERTRERERERDTGAARRPAP